MVWVATSGSLIEEKKKKNETGIDIFKKHKEKNGTIKAV